jgi:hypothetical protein
MPSQNDIDKNIRFFTSSSIFEKLQKCTEKQQEDLTPFGLNLQEAFPQDKQSPQDGITMQPCPTNTPSGGDCSLDVDIEF